MGYVGFEGSVCVSVVTPVMIFIWLMILVTPYLSFSFFPPDVDKNRESMSEQKLTVYIYSCFQVIHVQFSIA